MIQVSITNDELQLLPIETIDGKIVVVDTIKMADKELAVLSREQVIGFDTETRPSFRKGTTNKVALVQFATEQLSFLFRLNVIGAYKPLFELLENERVKKVGLGLESDFLALRRMQASFNPQGFVDVQTLAKGVGIEDQSLVKIYAILFGKRISKRQRLSNWEAEELSEAQQTYAALDALSCLHMYNKLNAIANARK